MDRMRHSRSVSRSRREERRSGSIRSSHDSVAGNLSPGRHHDHMGHRSRSGREGGFFKNLFRSSSRDKRRDQQPLEQEQFPSHAYPDDSSPPPPPPVAPTPPPAAPRSASPWKKLFNSPARHSSPAPRGGGPSGAIASAADELALKDMQHRMQLLQAQVQDYERLKAQLAVEQRSAQEWKEKWNYQNLKLNVMVDMLVLRVLELEQPAGAAGR